MSRRVDPSAEFTCLLQSYGIIKTAEMQRGLTERQAHIATAEEHLESPYYQERNDFTRVVL